MARDSMFGWDDKQLRRAIDEAPALFDRVVARALTVSAHEGVRIMIPLEPGAEGGRGLLKGSTRAGRTISSSDLVESELLASISYAEWADKGRRPGKMPPEEPIEAWLRRLGVRDKVKAKAKPTSTSAPRRQGTRKGRAGRPQRRSSARKAGGASDQMARSRGSLTSLSLREATFLVRRKIAKKGTFKPGPVPDFTGKTVKKLQPITERHVANAIRAFAAEFNRR